MDDARILTLAELSIGEYAPIRAAYKMEIKSAIMEYFLTEKVAITKFRNAFKRAITNSFADGFWLGYVDGGGEPKEADPDDQEWLNGAITGEYGYVDDLFGQIKAMKKEGLTVKEYEAWAEARSEGYSLTLDKVYSQGKVRGAGNKMLTFGGNDGNESCETCQRLKGQRHSAKWWTKRGLVPMRGNRNYQCGNWQCEHLLYDDDGKVYVF